MAFYWPASELCDFGTANEPYSFVIFQGWGGGGSGPSIPPLDPCMGKKIITILSSKILINLELCVLQDYRLIYSPWNKLEEL